MTWEFMKNLQKFSDLVENYTLRLRQHYVKITLYSEIYFNLLIHLYFCSLTFYPKLIIQNKVIGVLKDSTL